MPVITISRLTGSGGAAIGQLLAERLGVSYLNTQIVREVAQRLGISEASAAEHNERSEAFIERLARVLAISNPSFGTINSPTMALPFESTTEAFVTATRRLVLEAAQSGNAVIFGHGAQFILAQRPDVLHVRFFAPLAARVERVMRRTKMSQAEAERWVREEDQRRANHIRQFYQADWHAPDPFHLLLNTARWDEETCIRLVMAAVKELEPPLRG
ncbi:MAG: cytidylate kinase-like family protein [Chloroflexi bacterium]|nr:cytidylate kinase-like family protein [Chloroflexota bacterium]